MTALNTDWLDQIRWPDEGVLPAVLPVIAQDADNGDILMVAWMDREALAKTVELGEAVYYSRSRQRLWHKGEESGHTQKIVEIRTDCDRDVILLKVRQTGGIACHTGRRSCFFERLVEGAWQAVDPVLKDPKTIYG